MSNKTLTKEKLQEVAYKAMSAVLTKDRIDHAYNDWLSTLSNTGEFSIIGFIKDFSEKHHLSEFKKNEFKAIIYNNLFTKESVNNRKEIYSAPEIKPATLNKTQGPVSNQFTTFSDFIRILIENAKNNGAQSSVLHASINNLISDTEITDDIQAGLINWIENHNNFKVAEKLSLSDMQSTIHIFYLVLCDILGPVKADNILSASVNKVKTLPSATHYSPDKFL